MRNTAAALLLILAAIGTGWALRRPPPSTPGDTSRTSKRSAAEIDLLATLTRERGRVGEALPLRFVLRNAGASAALVLPSLDASDHGRRFPRCDLKIFDESGVPQTAASGRFCGNVNSLEETDFVRLQPGETAELHHFLLHRWKPQRPGTYTLTFVYDSSPEDPSHWRSFDGPPSVGALKLLPAAAHVRLERTIQVHVDP